MPEGPELHLSSIFINRICKDLVFSGKVERNPVHKSADILWNEPEYKIEALSKGKELMLNLSVCKSNGTTNSKAQLKSTSILFTFGMSGKFEFQAANDLMKHSHLTFYTKNEPKMALSFVDYRRFGRWFQDSGWSSSRGPCVIQENNRFVQNVGLHLEKPAFNKPICEVLLNQEFFSGIGNYLRAEILYRCKIPPFEQARKALKLKDTYSESNQESQKPIIKEELLDAKVKEEPTDINHKEEVKEEAGDQSNHDSKKPKTTKRKGKKAKEEEVSQCKYPKVEVNGSDIKISKEDTNEETPRQIHIDDFEEKAQELLRLCHSVPLEVVELGSQKSSLSEMYYDDTDGSFNNWLQCYNKDGMRNMVDHNKRTMWFTGPAGPMAPKEEKQRKPQKKKKASKSADTDVEIQQEESTADADTVKPKSQVTRKLLSDSVKPKTVKTSTKHKVKKEEPNSESDSQLETKQQGSTETSSFHNGSELTSDGIPGVRRSSRKRKI